MFSLLGGRGECILSSSVNTFKKKTLNDSKECGVVHWGEKTNDDGEENNFKRVRTNGIGKREEKRRNERLKEEYKTHSKQEEMGGRLEEQKKGN